MAKSFFLLYSSPVLSTHFSHQDWANALDDFFPIPEEDYEQQDNDFLDQLVLDEAIEQTLNYSDDWNEENDYDFLDFK